MVVLCLDPPFSLLPAIYQKKCKRVIENQTRRNTENQSFLDKGGGGREEEEEEEEEEERER